LKRVLKAIEAAREEGIAVKVTGLDEFEIGDFSAQLADAQQLLSLGIESPTLKKEIFKTLAAQYLSDAPQSIKDQISKEIDAAG
jgi:predicted membrane GTPase involved in stress response